MLRGGIDDDGGKRTAMEVDVHRIASYRLNLVDSSFGRNRRVHGPVVRNSISSPSRFLIA